MHRKAFDGRGSPGPTGWPKVLSKTFAWRAGARTSYRPLHCRLRVFQCPPPPSVICPWSCIQIDADLVMRTYNQCTRQPPLAACSGAHQAQGHRSDVQSHQWKRSTIPRNLWTDGITDRPGGRRLSSAATNCLLVPSVRLSTISSRTIPVAGPQAWNDLPDEVITASSLPVFRQRLNTLIFRMPYPDIII